MIFNSFVTQIAMAIVAVGILFTYVQPTFSKIGTIQESVEQYQAEQEKVASVNASLATLVQKVNNISSADMKALLTYLPDEVDQVKVSRDIFLMAEEADVYLRSVQYDGIYEQEVPVVTGELVPTLPTGPTGHSFVLDFSGTYDQTKLLLSLLEQNNYPLEVHELSVAPVEGGLLETSLKVVTYSHLGETATNSL